MLKTIHSTVHIAAQGALTDVSCALTRADGGILASSILGTFPAISDGSLGSGAPVVTLSNVIKGATGVTMSLTFTPTFVVPSAEGRALSAPCSFSASGKSSSYSPSASSRCAAS